MSKSKRQITISVGFLVLLLALASPALGQAGQNPPSTSDGVVRVYSELVQTDVRVFDKLGRFHRGSGLRFIVYVYNAALSPTDSKPDVALQVQVLRDGQPVINAPSKRISSEGLKQLNQIPYGADISLEGLSSGRYVLQISIVDRIAKSSATQQMRFEIE